MVKKVKPHNYWNKERCTAELSKYTRKLDAKYGSPSAYNSAYNHGWLEEIAPHLTQKHRWSREKCFKEVRGKGYKNKKELRDGAIGCYEYAQRHGFLDELCEGMEVLGNYALRKIYAFEFDDGYAYVGLTCNPTKRKWQHLHDQYSAVYKHYFPTKPTFTFRILTDWLKQEDAQKCEDAMIQEYSRKGWKMLNRKNGGDLGSARDWLYNMDELKKEAKKYTYRTEFRKKSPAMYAFADCHGLLDVICAHMPKHYFHALRWTEERIREVIEECNHSSGLVEDKYPGVMESIRRNGTFERYFGKKPRKARIRTLEETIQECAKYKTISELRKSDYNLYTYVKRHNWQEECFRHLEDDYVPPRKAPYTWEEIEDKIRLCSNRRDMKEKFEREYRAALKNPEWRQRFYLMLPKAKPRKSESKKMHPHYKWTIERSVEMASTCKSRRELHLRHPGAYEVLLKAGLLSKLIPSRMHCEKYDDEEKMAIVALCKDKRQLHDHYRPVYDWLRLANRLDEFYPKRIGRKS